MKTRSFRLRILAQTLPFLLIAPGLALAQTPPTRGEATAALNQPARPGAQEFTRQQIDQLVAPIALYPDQLLSQVLMAASYPQQVVEAARWVQDQDHANLKGDQLIAALEPLPWEPSVKALVPFPQILVMMSEHIEWTQALGVAFVTQQREVMARVQSLRHLAMKSGRIDKVKHLKVREEGQTIVITESEPGRIFVPVYNPTVVYGTWPDQGFPPVFIPPPQGFVAETIEPGLEVSVGYTVVQPLWGWSRVDWRDERITVDRTEYTRITRNVEVGPGGVWRHSGPVVLVSPSEARTVTTRTTANIPAGTVLPARAAAVTVLPQRAAADPQRIKTQTTTNETRTTQPGANPTERNRANGTQPGANPNERNQATSAQPSGTEPGKSGTGQPENRTGANRPNATEPGQNRTNAANPSAAQPGTSPAPSQPMKSEAAPNRSTSEPGKTGNSEARTNPNAATPNTATQSGTSEPGRADHEKSAAGKAGHGKSEAAKSNAAEPSKSEANTAAPNERQSRHHESAKGNEAKGEGSTAAPSESRSREHGKTEPGSAPQLGPSEHGGSSTPSEAQQPTPRQREHNGAAASPSRHEEPSSRALERGGSSTSPEAQRPGAQTPQRSGAAATPGQREERMQMPQAGGSGGSTEPQHQPGHAAEHSGSSTPPAASAPHASPTAQPAHGQAGGHQEGRSEEHGKKHEE